MNVAWRPALDGWLRMLQPAQTQPHRPQLRGQWGRSSTTTTAYTLAIPLELVGPLFLAARHRQVTVATYLLHALETALDDDGVFTRRHGIGP